MSPTRSHTQKKVFAASFSVASNTFLTISKLIIGFSIGSVSVLSEAIHSMIDLLAAIIALFAVRTSSKPADREHPFGHGKIETISGAIEAILIFVAAAWIIFEALEKFSSPKPIEALEWGVAVMAISSLMNFLVSRYLFRIAKETDSIALAADGWHLRTDVYTSMGVLVGLAAIEVCRYLFPNVNLLWLDPAAAILVAVLILKAAVELTIKSARELMDESLPADEINAIKDKIRGSFSTIKSCHSLKTRKSGPSRFIEFHLAVDSNMSVKDSHAITEDLERVIKEMYPGSDVTIHIEPCDNRFCHAACESGCYDHVVERRSSGSID